METSTKVSSKPLSWKPPWRRSPGKSWDMLQFMWRKVRRFNFDPNIDIRIMKYMVVTTNVSNCTNMMARTMHIIHHCIFTNMDHIYTKRRKHIDTYANAIKYQLCIIGMNMRKTNIKWAYVTIQIRLIGHALHAHVHPLYIHMNAHARVHEPTCTYPAWRARILHTNSHKCLSCYHIHSILESYSLHRMKL